MSETRLPVKRKRSKGRFSPKQLLAVESIVANPMLDKKLLAKELGIAVKTLYNWFNSPEIIDRIYNRYMEVAGLELPAVIGATIEEAKAGNVHAARLVLEHFGKLEKKVKIQIESPFEKFMKVEAEESEYEIIDPEVEEIVEDNVEFIDKLSETVKEEIVLPKRNPENDNPTLRLKKEKKSLKNKISVKQQQNSAYKIRKRAKAVGLELLPGGKHKKSVRKAWLEELERLEAEQK